MLNIDKNQVIKEVKSVGPFLAPFFKTSCIYFILTLEDPTLLHAFVKVLPILCLIFLVYWLQGDQGDSYSRFILSGLVVCAVGDVVLVWQDTDELFFFLGLGLFVLGHISYIVAFGFTPFGLKEFVLAASISTVIYSVLFPGLVTTLWIVAVGLYTGIIGVMAWRAIARFNLKGEIPWRKVYAALGSLMFVASDTILGVNKFIWKIPHDKEMIMVPYYMAQMGIALSVINSRLVVKDKVGNGVIKNAKEQHFTITS